MTLIFSCQTLRGGGRSSKEKKDKIQKTKYIRQNIKDKNIKDKRIKDKSKPIGTHTESSNLERQ